MATRSSTMCTNLPARHNGRCAASFAQEARSTRANNPSAPWHGGCPSLRTNPHVLGSATGPLSVIVLGSPLPSVSLLLLCWWNVLARGALRAHPKGWQRYAASVLTSALSRCFQWPGSCVSRAWGGDAASCALTSFPTMQCADLVAPDAKYCVLLLRRVRLPLPLAPKHCRCGSARGHQRRPPRSQHRCPRHGRPVANGLPLWRVPL